MKKILLFVLLIISSGTINSMSYWYDIVEYLSEHTERILLEVAFERCATRHLGCSELRRHLEQYRARGQCDSICSTVDYVQEKCAVVFKARDMGLIEHLQTDHSMDYHNATQCAAFLEHTADH